MRPELTEPPERMRHLPLDRRGYPIPAFVQWVNGEPDFRIMNPQHWHDCIVKDLCWVCGARIGAFLVFPIGPMCAINRTASEPPCHRECALWSVRNCPFLARPHMVRREDDLSREAIQNVSGVMIPRNPGAVCLWTTKKYKLFRDNRNRPLIELGDPVKVEWYAEGRPATRSEVMESVRTGMPILEEMAARDGGKAMADLCRAYREMLPLLPAAV